MPINEVGYTLSTVDSWSVRNQVLDVTCSSAPCELWVAIPVILVPLPPVTGGRGLIPSPPSTSQGCLQTSNAMKWKAVFYKPQWAEPLNCVTLLLCGTSVGLRFTEIWTLQRDGLESFTLDGIPSWLFLVLFFASASALCVSLFLSLSDLESRHVWVSF